MVAGCSLMLRYRDQVRYFLRFRLCSFAAARLVRSGAVLLLCFGHFVRTTCSLVTRFREVWSMFARRKQMLDSDGVLLA